MEWLPFSVIVGRPNADTLLAFPGPLAGPGQRKHPRSIAEPSEWIGNEAAAMAAASENDGDRLP